MSEVQCAAHPATESFKLLGLKISYFVIYFRVCDKRALSSSNKAEIGKNVMCMVYNMHMDKFHCHHGLQVESHVESLKTQNGKKKKCPDLFYPSCSYNLHGKQEENLPGVREAS